MSKILLEENPTLTEEEFEKYKDTCAIEAAKAKVAKYKSLQQRNMGKHRLGSRGYLGKRPIWDKEDVEREAAGLPDPFAKFTNPLERDFIRARYKWDKEKKGFLHGPDHEEIDWTTGNYSFSTLHLAPYLVDYTFLNGSCSFYRRSNTSLQPKALLLR